MSGKQLPITTHASSDAVVAIWKGREIRLPVFLQHINSVAAQLPTRKFVVNLCEDRYLFLVAFFAALSKYQTNLLPTSKLPAVIAETVREFTDAYILSDDAAIAADLVLHAEELPVVTSQTSTEVMVVNEDHVAAVVFTSGSTGKPRPNIKTWGSLCVSAQLAIQRFEFAPGKVKAVLATVPAQHMYGLETSVVIPLLSGVSIVCARAFYPADIQALIECVNAEVALITTPFHLKACVDAGLMWRNIKFVISATAVMPLELAKRVETTLHTTLYEIYGASEFGSIASRRTLNDILWKLYDRMTLLKKPGGYYICGPQLKSDLPIQDVIELEADGYFRLLGRNTELVKVAGKRIALGDLNQQLARIDGVLDGVFFMPDATTPSLNQRLTAMVVAPGCERQYILDELKKRIDPVFLPRPLLLVDELPRNATGKIPKQELLSLYESLSANSPAQ